MFRRLVVCSVAQFVTRTYCSDARLMATKCRYVTPNPADYLNLVKSVNGRSGEAKENRIAPPWQQRLSIEPYRTTTHWNVPSLNWSNSEIPTRRGDFFGAAECTAAAGLWLIHGLIPSPRTSSRWVWVTGYVRSRRRRRCFWAELRLRYSTTTSERRRTTLFHHQNRYRGF